MDVDLVTILVPFLAVLLGAVLVVAARLWARGVESALASSPGMPAGTSPGDAPAANPAILLQPPEDSPPA